MKPPLNDRFWASTRGCIILQLRGENRSISDMAEALALTDNAVRAHVTALERDGFVRQAGSRRGLRKPTVVYGLTAEAEHLFPKGYAPILRHFLDVVKERVSPEELDDIARTVAHRMAPAHRPVLKAGTAPNLADQAHEVLRGLGGGCDSEEKDGKIVFHCSDCPLASVVMGHPEVCRLVETILAEVLGVPVRERCQLGETPRCAFEITPPGK